MSNQPEEEAPKIIVDEDWKSQVEQEKRMAGEAAKPAGEAAEAATPEPPAAADPRTAADDAPAEGPPPAGFDALVTMLLTQALVALGQIPGPDGSTAAVNKPMAKYFIDTVEMLQQKTQGNLTDEESKLVAESLHAMRMAYVSAKSK